MPKPKHGRNHGKHVDIPGLDVKMSRLQNAFVQMAQQLPGSDPALNAIIEEVNKDVNRNVAKEKYDEDKRELHELMSHDGQRKQLQAHIDAYEKKEYDANIEMKAVETYKDQQSLDGEQASVAQRDPQYEMAEAKP